MREEYLLDPSIVFLNHGSFGACPAEVLAAQQEWQREMERNPVEFLGRRSAALLAASRERLANFLGAQARDLVFVSNATTAINALARSIELNPADEVLTTDQEYGACDAAWRWVCERAGARVVSVPVPLPLDRDAFVERLLAHVTRRTRVVTLSHVTSTTALVVPVEEICRRAREMGILTVIDGAHVPGHIPLDLENTGADAYAGNCHKWLGAPKGAGFLWAREEHHPRIHAPVVSWGYCEGVDSHAGFDGYLGSTVLERRLQWQGTRDISAFLAVPAAIDFLERHDWPAVRHAGHDLAAEALERVGALTALQPISSVNDFGQMVAIPLPPCDAEELRAALFDRYRIEVPVTTHAGTQYVRPAFHIYNSRLDLDALLAALEALLSGAGPSQ